MSTAPANQPAAEGEPTPLHQREGASETAIVAGLLAEGLDALGVQDGSQPNAHHSLAQLFRAVVAKLTPPPPGEGSAEGAAVAAPGAGLTREERVAQLTAAGFNPDEANHIIDVQGG